MFIATWLVKKALGKLGPKDSKRLADGLGLWSPEMQKHWDRLKETKGLDGHSLVNIGTEWIRLDPQRALKVSLDSSLLTAIGIGLLVLL
jgi:hypothetical protein